MSSTISTSSVKPPSKPCVMWTVDYNTIFLAVKRGDEYLTQKDLYHNAQTALDWLITRLTSDTFKYSAAIRLLHLSNQTTSKADIESFEKQENPHSSDNQRAFRMTSEHCAVTDEVAVQIEEMRDDHTSPTSKWVGPAIVDQFLSDVSSCQGLTYSIDVKVSEEYQRLLKAVDISGRQVRYGQKMSRDAHTSHRRKGGVLLCHLGIDYLDDGSKGYRLTCGMDTAEEAWGLSKRQLQEWTNNTKLRIYRYWDAVWRGADEVALTSALQINFPITSESQSIDPSFPPPQILDGYLRSNLSQKDGIKFVRKSELDALAWAYGTNGIVHPFAACHDFSPPKS